MHDATQSTVEKYIETVNRKIEELERNKNMLQIAIAKIPDVFVSHEKKKEVMAILERIGVSYCKLFYSKVYAWTKGEEE